MTVDARIYEALQKVRPGGKLIIKTVHPEVKADKGEKFPDAFLEYKDPETVQREKEEYEASRGNRQSSDF